MTRWKDVLDETLQQATSGRLRLGCDSLKADRISKLVLVLHEPFEKADQGAVRVEDSGCSVNLVELRQEGLAADRPAVVCSSQRVVCCGWGNDGGQHGLRDGSPWREQWSGSSRAS